MASPGEMFNVGRFACAAPQDEAALPYFTPEERAAVPVGSLVCAYGFRFRLTTVG
jgi:hypothetical protein